MPYTASDSPAYVPKKHRHAWAATWNAAYASALKEGKSKEKAESYAFAVASAKWGPNSKKAFDDLLAKSSELYLDTGTYDEEHENEIREQITLWGDYAESGPTYDPEGKYLCGTCAMRVGDDDCTHVTSPISFTTGSCRIWEIGDSSSDEDDLPEKLTQTEVVYTERPNVKGFGCSRCEFGSEAKEEDSDGREMWCSFWGTHVETLACCFKNTGDDDVVAPVEQAEKSLKLLDFELEKLLQQVSGKRK